MEWLEGAESYQGGRVMNNSIAPEYLSFDDLVTKKLYRIPAYQRSYSWTKKQRKDLFEDIKKLYRTPDKNRVHFMSTIVCHQRPETEDIENRFFKVLNVVDGQQRLTTLVILLKEIWRYLYNHGYKESISVKDLERLLVKNEKQLLLLHLYDKSSIIFREYLTNGKIPNINNVETYAEKNLVNAFNDCGKFVNDCEHIFGDNGKNGVMELLTLVMNRLYFLLHILEDESIVYTLFEVLNSRGLEVDWLDKCKCMLMGAVFDRSGQDTKEERINELNNIWSEIYSTIGLDNSISGSDIIRFTTLFRRGKTLKRLSSEDESMSILREEAIKAPANAIDISKHLLDVTKELHKLLLNNRIKVVSKILQARLLAVSIMLADYLSNNEKQKALDQWERVTFRIYGLCRRDSRSKIGDYVSLACQINTEEIGFEEVMKQLTNIGSDEFSIKESVKHLQSADCYNGWDDEVKYFMYRYEEYLSEVKGIGINKALWAKIWETSPDKTIEHIYPQTERDEWKDKIRSKNKKLQCNRLGNLTVLPDTFNKEAHNKAFDKKKEIYSKSDLLIVKEIVSKDDWTQDTIEERENDLIDWAKSTWNDLELNITS